MWYTEIARKITTIINITTMDIYIEVTIMLTKIIYLHIAANLSNNELLF